MAEHLETRLLLAAGTSVSAQISGQELAIHGTDNNDTIAVKWLRDDAASGRLVVTVAGQAAMQFSSASVSRILLFSYNGNDSVWNTTHLPMTAYGGEGNDRLYGGSGSDRLSGNQGSDTLSGGVGDDFYFFGTASSAESDLIVENPGQGTDTISFTPLSTAVTLNLGTSAVQQVHTNRTLRLSSGGGMEKATGGSGDDRIFGNALNNTLSGNGGHDILVGGSGSDILIGGAGNDSYLFGAAAAPESDSIIEGSSAGIDTLSFLSVTSAVTVNLASTSPQRIHTNRVLTLSSGTSLENVFGGSGNDRITGNSLDNTLSGGAGSDAVAGGTGHDTYLFGAAAAAEADVVYEVANGGQDSLDFTSLTIPVTMNLGSGATQAVHSNRTVRLNSVALFEGVLGGTGNDRLTGNQLLNILSGGNGNDILNGSAGDDHLQGGLGDDIYLFSAAAAAEQDRVTEVAGAGTDTLSFASLTTAVRLSLALSTPQAVHTNRTLLLTNPAAIENLIGGSGNDILTGNAQPNVLHGGNGNDTVRGGHAADRIAGGAGRDYLRGGDGDDVISGGPDNDNIDGELGFDIVNGDDGDDIVVGEKIDGNTIPLLPVLIDRDVPRTQTQLSIELPAHDADGDQITYTVSSAEDEVQTSISGNTLLITRSAGFMGRADISITAADGRGLTDTREFSVVTRNRLPEISPVENVRRLQGAGGFRVPFSVTDADGDAVIRTFTSSTPGVGLDVVTNPSGGHELVVAPTGSFTGTATITMLASDGIDDPVSYVFTVDVVASLAVQNLTASTSEYSFFVRLDDQGNVYYWRNRDAALSPELIAENTKSLAAGTGGRIFRLGNDGSLNRRNADGTWTDYPNAPSGIGRIHAAAGYLFLIPEGGGTVGVLDPATGNMNPALIVGTVQNEVAGGNLHSLDASGNLFINGAPHLGPMLMAGNVPLYHAAQSRVREITVAHDKLYYLTADRTVYRVVSPSPLGSVRETDYSNVLRIRGLDKTLYVVTRSGYVTYWEDGGLGGAGASIGVRQKFAADQNSAYTLEGGRLYRIPAGVDENPIYLRDDVASILGHAGRLYRLDTNGSLYRRGLEGGYEQLGTGIRSIYEVARKMFVFHKNGHLDMMVDGNLTRIAVGVRQFTHTGDFYAGQPYLLYEDGRVARVRLTDSAVEVIGGSPALPYSSIAVGDHVLLAFRRVDGIVDRWSGSSFTRTSLVYSSPGRVLSLVEADGIAAALLENKAILEWRTDRWRIITTNYSPTEIIIGVDFEQLAGDQDRMFATDSDGDLWTIPLLRDGSRDYGRGDWLSVPKPLNSTNSVFQLVEAGGRIYARQSRTVFEFSDVRDYTDQGDWTAVGGSTYTGGSQTFWDMVSAGGELYVRDAFQNARVLKYGGSAGVWTDVSGSYRFNRLGVSTEGNLVGYRAPNDEPVAYIGNSWEQTTLLWRRGRVLTISGRDTKNDYLKLAIDGDFIVATVNDPNGQQVYSSRAGTEEVLRSFQFLKSEIDRVVFHGLGGNDTLVLDDSWNSFVPVIGYGGSGDDTFMGRVGYDQFYGEGGRDTITWQLDLTAYLNGQANAINTQADMVGDRIIVDVRLGQAIRAAFEETHRFIENRLRPVTEFLNSDLVNIQELNFRITWRQAISRIRGLRELVRFHDELVELSQLFTALPVQNGMFRLGTFEVTGSSFASITGNSTSPFVSLNNHSTIQALRSYGITFPFLLDGREMVKVVVGLPVELVTVNTKLSTWLTDEQLADADLVRTAQGIEPEQAIVLANGIVFFGPVPVQWALKFNYGFDLAIIAGLDTSGIARGGLSRVREGLYLRSFSLTAYGKLIGEAGWDANELGVAMPDLEFVEFVAPRAEIVGEIGLSQTYTYSNGSKYYLFARNTLTPTLTVTTTLFGSLRLEAQAGIEAKGWLSDALDYAEVIVDAAEAYVEIYENVLDFLGRITGRKVRRVRRPEIEIKKRVDFDFTRVLADFETSRQSVFRI